MAAKAPAEKKAMNNVEITQAATEQRRETYKELSQQELHTVTIAPMYSTYFGKNMPIGINGVVVYVPVDGRAYKIPRSYAAIVAERIAAVNAYITKQGRMSSVQENFEQYIGQLKFT